MDDAKLDKMLELRAKCASLESRLGDKEAEVAALKEEVRELRSSAAAGGAAAGGAAAGGAAEGGATDA